MPNYRQSKISSILETNSPPSIKFIGVAWDIIAYICSNLFILSRSIVSRVSKMNTFKNLRAHGIVASTLKKKQIFVFGAPHAGKSTLLASLLYHISHDDKYVLRRNPLKNKEGVVLIKELLNNIENGDYPQPTPPEFWQEIVFEYENRTNAEKRSFSFHEIAGETVEKFDPTHSQHSSISKSLKNTLLHSSAVMLVASLAPEKPSERDSLIDFVELLLRSNYKKPILFVATKFDKVQSEKIEKPIRIANRSYRDVLRLLLGYGPAGFIAYTVGGETEDKVCKQAISVSAPQLMKWLEQL